MDHARFPAKFTHFVDRAYGHFWTVAPHLRGLMTRWSTGFVDRIEVRYTDARGISLISAGYLHRNQSADTVFILVHGLGGTPDSSYVRDACDKLWHMGYAVLRVGLRGAECDQPDFYNAGLIEDVEILLSNSTIQQYKNRFLVGFSLGGHIALTVATAEKSKFINGVVSICAPLDLHETQKWLDRPRINLYRNHCLDGLKRTLRAVKRVAGERNIELPVHWEALDEIQTIRDWDAHIVCPRFGFQTVDAYYDQVSIGPRLNRLHIPTLIISARYDPMVPIKSLIPHLRNAQAESWILDQGAHVGFPSRVDTEVARGRGLYESIVRWCEQQV